MKSIATAIFASTACLIFAGCDPELVNGAMGDCSQKALRVHGPGNSERKIDVCDGQGVADELDKNCSDSVVDLCDVIQSKTESCEWERVSSNLTDTQFDWVSDEETEMEIRYVKVGHWGCTSN